MTDDDSLKLWCECDDWSCNAQKRVGICGNRASRFVLVKGVFGIESIQNHHWMCEDCLDPNNECVGFHFLEAVDK